MELFFRLISGAMDSVAIYLKLLRYFDPDELAHGGEELLFEPPPAPRQMQLQEGQKEGWR